MRPTRDVRPALEALESRRLLASVADADLFGPAQTVHVSGASQLTGFAAPAYLVDGSTTAFAFADDTRPQRLSISNFNGAIHTLRFFRGPVDAGDAPPAVTVYHSPVTQAALTPASYRRVGTFSMPTSSSAYAEVNGLEVGGA